MKKTLYLVRKPIDQINPAVFLPSESQGDVVLLNESGRRAFSFRGGSVFLLNERVGGQGISYDELVKKIFECDHTVVI